MQKKFVYNIVSLLLFMLPLCVGGCEDKAESVLHGEQATPVRILTAVNFGYSSEATRMASTRLGTVNEDNVEYSEGIEDGNLYENTVVTLRVMVFEQGGAIRENILFRKPGMQIGEGEKTYKYADGAGNVITRIQMDFKIEPGTYRFVLIANELSGWGLGDITSRSELSTSAALTGIEHGQWIAFPSEMTGSLPGIPMVGEQELTVPFDETSTELNPTLVSPAIELKRTFAKLEINMTNIDPETEEVYETAKEYRVLGGKLYTANKYYALMEDATANNEIIREIPYNYTHQRGNPISGNIYSFYMPERKNVPDAENATSVDIYAEVVENEPALVFNIPLYQKKENTLNYDIHRNTIYRLNTILKGQLLSYKLDVYNIVEGWNTIYGSIDVTVPREYFANINAKYMTVTSANNGSSYSGKKEFLIHTNLELSETDFFEVEENGFTLSRTSTSAGIYLLTVSYQGGGFGTERVPIILHFSKDGKKALSLTIEAVMDAP